MRMRITPVAGPLLAGALLAGTVLPAVAAEEHNGANGQNQPPMPMSDMDMDAMDMDSMDMSQMKKLPVKPGDAPGGHGGHGMHGGGHAHDSWVEPPAAYAQQVISDWNSFERAKSGMALYLENCVSCHGVDGRGTGPLAKSLKHPPADLTNHFHMAPGQGDQYLFWRVTEGGMVEPFASADSAMPAFKHNLSEAQRWDVLTYIHQVFHRGFKSEAMPGMGGMPPGGHGH